MAANDKVAPGTPAQQDPQAVKAAAKEQKVHEEATEKRTSSKVGEFDTYEDAYADYQEKQTKLSDVLAEFQAAEQALPALKIALQQKQVDELKEKGTEYDDQGRPLGILGTPVSNPTMYGGNPAPDTLGEVH
jgi:hypothetical protein